MQQNDCLNKENLSKFKKPFKISMLRSCFDEPIIRYVSVTNNGHVAVKSESSYLVFKNEGKGINDWIGWHLEDVYDFDEHDFRELMELWRKGEREELKMRWGQCQPFLLDV